MGRGAQPGQQVDGSNSWTAPLSGSSEKEGLNCCGWCQTESLAPRRGKRIAEYGQQGLQEEVTGSMQRGNSYEVPQEKTKST